MKTIQKRLGALAALVFFGILAASCTDLGENYDGTAWYGEDDYVYDHIGVTFHDGGRKCFVGHIITGFEELRYEMDVDWSSRSSFKLSIPGDEQALAWFSGSISGETMYLEELDPHYGRVNRVFTLTKTM